MDENSNWRYDCDSYVGTEHNIIDVSGQIRSQAGHQEYENILTPDLILRPRPLLSSELDDIIKI